VNERIIKVIPPSENVFGPGRVDLSNHSGFRSSKEESRVRAYLALIALDLACLLVGYSLAGLLRTGWLLHLSSLRPIVVMLPTFLGVALNNGAYSISALERPSAGAAKACVALLFSVAGVIAFLFYLKVSADFSRLIFGLGTVISALLLVLGRWSFGHWIGRLHDWSFENTLVLVDDVPIIPRRGEVIVFADEAGIAPSGRNPSTLNRLASLIEHCERIIIACPMDRRASWAHILKGCAIDVEILAPEMLSVGAVALRSSHDRRTLLVSARPLGLRDRIWKRALDLVIASSALIMLAPLMGIIAVLIKLETRGPILFKQARVGLNSQMFTVLKFRSMRADRADYIGCESTRRNDQRLTRLGSFLRHTSLDELPQLINVFKGDMSIVGPRPHALGSTAERRLFWDIDTRYFHRHAIKPGMTGLAQVRGFRGATERQSDLTNRLQSDLEYLSGWTIWRDLKIIVDTFKVIANGNAF